MTPTRRTVTAGLLAAATLGPLRAQAMTRDIELTAADGRKVQVRIYGPARPRRGKAVLIFSHGANGTLDGLGPIMRLLARDRIVAAPLHIDSEAHALHGKSKPVDIWRTRIEDMALVRAAVAMLAPTAPIVAAGHSYGALIAQTLGGATPYGKDVRDPLVKSVVAISPPGPLPNFVSAADWAKVAVPMLVTTGTLDTFPVIAPEWSAHATSFVASATHDSALWVGRGVDHYYGHMIQRLMREAPDQSAAFTAMLDIADKFIAANAEGDTRAKRWLAGGEVPKRYASLTERWEWRA